MSIRFVIHKEIDKQKWDNCILHAINGLIYGNTFYLDAMAEHWDALVLNDYEAVMPLTWKIKWGIRYLYQPAFIQQLGIFYRRKPALPVMTSFLKAALEKFSFAEITLNFSNDIEELPGEAAMSRRNNFLLDLNRPYETICDNYDASFKKSLRRVRKFNLIYLESTNYKKIIEQYKILYGKKLNYISKRSYRQLEDMCRELVKDKKVIVRLVCNAENTLLAAVVLLTDKNRIYNIISCLPNEGKRREANYFLYDNIINEFAGKGFLFDFEGSDVAGIAAFYKKFNPENQLYPFVKYNNLPWYVKMFKQ